MKALRSGRQPIILWRSVISQQKRILIRLWYLW